MSPALQDGLFPTGPPGKPEVPLIRDWSNWIMSYCTAVSITDAILGPYTPPVLLLTPPRTPLCSTFLLCHQGLCGGQVLCSGRQVQVASGLSASRRSRRRMMCSGHPRDWRPTHKPAQPAASSPATLLSRAPAQACGRASFSTSLRCTDRTRAFRVCWSLSPRSLDTPHLHPATLTRRVQPAHPQRPARELAVLPGWVGVGWQPRAPLR